MDNHGCDMRHPSEQHVTTKTESPRKSRKVLGGHVGLNTLLPEYWAIKLYIN